jgi:hypothetical protein
MLHVTPRTLAARELLQLFRRLGEARGWRRVDEEAAHCVSKERMAGLGSVALVKEAARDGSLNAALKAAGAKQFGAVALDMLAGRALMRRPVDAVQAEPMLDEAGADACPICMVRANASTPNIHGFTGARGRR